MNHKSKIGHVLQFINIAPLLTLGVITMLLGYFWFSRAMRNEVELELQTVAHHTNLLLDTAYPGDYQLVGENSFRLYKGDTDITENYELLDQVKGDTDWEVTVFYQDTRILTTIRDSEGARLIGTAAPEPVIDDVLETGEAKFYTTVFIYNSSYFSYCMPLVNSDGNTVGMLFVGKPSQAVNSSIQESLYPLLVATCVITLIMIVILSFYTKAIVALLMRIRTFLADVATGNLNTRLHPSVANRGDEIGDIGRSALSMQQSLRIMVEQDGLTGLFNRRFGDRKLKEVVNKYENCNTPFALSIGDIDFFKKVNDTYGHDCGDIVLKTVAEILRRHMNTKGFVARWGGEEFLLVFDNSTAEQAYSVLEEILNEIRATEINYDNQTIKVTMTFGLIQGDTTNITELLCRADEKLYLGKTGGRNRIIIKGDETIKGDIWIRKI